MSTATTTDILDALRAAMQRPSPQGDGHTGPELRAALGGMSQVRFKTLLLPLLQSGQVIIVQVSRQCMNGRPARIPGYRFVKKA